MKDYLEGLKNGDMVSSIVVAKITGKELEDIESAKTPVHVWGKNAIDIIGGNSVFETFFKTNYISTWKYCGRCWKGSGRNEDARVSKMIYVYADFTNPDDYKKDIEDRMNLIAQRGDIPINPDFIFPSSLDNNLPLKESLEDRILELCDDVLIICKDGAKHSEKCSEIINYCVDRKMKAPAFKVI